MCTSWINLPDIMNLPGEQEKGDTKEYMLDDSIFIKFNLIFGDTGHRVVAVGRGINCEWALRAAARKVLS